MEQLIDLLDENSCLWDVSNKDYYLRKKRERAYKQIEEKLGTETAVIKAKTTTSRQRCWQLLRSFACTTQQVPTTPNIVWPNNVVTCCIRLHGPLRLQQVSGQKRSRKLKTPRKFSVIYPRKQRRLSPFVRSVAILGFHPLISTSPPFLPICFLVFSMISFGHSIFCYKRYFQLRQSTEMIWNDIFLLLTFYLKCFRKCCHESDVREEQC